MIRGVYPGSVTDRIFPHPGSWIRIRNIVTNALHNDVVHICYIYVYIFLKILIFNLTEFYFLFRLRRLIFN